MVNKMNKRNCLCICCPIGCHLKSLLKIKKSMEIPAKEVYGLNNRLLIQSELLSSYSSKN